MSTLNFKFYLFLLIIKIFLVNNQKLKSPRPYSVTLDIYSGRENPIFYISEGAYNYVRNLNRNRLSINTIRNFNLGYRGFIVNCEDSQENFYIYGNADKEEYLKNEINDKLSTEIQDVINREMRTRRSKDNNNYYSLLEISQTVDQGLCEIPVICNYNQKPTFYVKDDPCNYCFIKKKYLNNCYNYSCNIASDTYAQPGRASGYLFTEFSCQSVMKGMISDGLQFIGKNYPFVRTRRGYYVGLFVWPANDYHLTRLNLNEFWSHKIGTNTPLNIDSDGKTIFNPLNQNLNPYNDFCGFFFVLHNKVKIQ
jgi:hypothetical protein